MQASLPSAPSERKAGLIAIMDNLEKEIQRSKTSNEELNDFTKTDPQQALPASFLALPFSKGLTPPCCAQELVVAVTVFAVLVPSSMAFGDLAGVTPVAGLYVALGAMVMYALFGTSRLVITGPEATSAIMTATAVAPLAAATRCVMPRWRR